MIPNWQIPKVFINGWGGKFKEIDDVYTKGNLITYHFFPDWIFVMDFLLRISNNRKLCFPWFSHVFRQPQSGAAPSSPGSQTGEPKTCNPWRMWSFFARLGQNGRNTSQGFHWKSAKLDRAWIVDLYIFFVDHYGCLGGGNSIFFIFTPKLGKIFTQFWRLHISIFFRWVGWN